VAETRTRDTSSGFKRYAFWPVPVHNQRRDRTNTDKTTSISEWDSNQRSQYTEVGHARIARPMLSVYRKRNVLHGGDLRAQRKTKVTGSLYSVELCWWPAFIAHWAKGQSSVVPLHKGQVYTSLQTTVLHPFIVKIHYSVLTTHIQQRTLFTREIPQRTKLVQEFWLS
jgi:hypothetical protein